MGVPERSELNQTPDAESIIEFLLTPEGVETLIASGRIPGLIDFKNPKGRAFCFIPPERTQIGDHFTRYAGAVIFTSPDGQNRGMAEMYEVSKEQAQQLKIRIKKALGRRDSFAN